DGRGRPPGDRGVDRGAHGAPRRSRDGAQQTRRRHGSRADDVEERVMTTGAMTTVFLVDDHQLFLSGVRAELGDEFEVVGSASEVDAAIELIGERAPDVVLVDVHMPAGGGPRVIREVLASHPDTKFLALSVSDSPDDVIATIRAGARGYVTKSIAPGEL